MLWTIKQLIGKQVFGRRKFTATLLPSRYSSGLLSGLDDPSYCNFYSPTLNIEQAAKMLKQQNPSAISCAAVMDWKRERVSRPAFQLDDHLKEIQRNALSWNKKNEIWDRKELMTCLNYVASSSGGFVCFLGGKSTGKTLALRTLSQTRNNVIKINGRMLTGGSILQSVVAEVLKNSHTLQVYDIAAKNPHVLLDGILDTVCQYYGLPPTTPFAEVVGKIKFPENKERHADELSKLLTMIAKLKGPLTLVMDEANLMFNPNEDQEDLRAAKKYLEVLTALSKESQQINVILTSSEHSFPFKLADPPLGFTMSNFTELIFAGEVPPSEMYKLLMEEWGAGPHLAEALLDHYGGHIWDCYHAVSKLAFLGSEEFRPGVGFGVGAAANVLDVLAFKEGSDEDRKRMKDVLRQLAERGFAPLYGNPYEDPVARKISEMNVGGVVSEAGTVIGLPRSVWQDEATGESFEHGLVPHKQSIRLLIAKALAQKVRSK